MSREAPTDTLSFIDDGALLAERRAPYLFLALSAPDPRIPPLRIALDDIDEILVGRGSEPKIELPRPSGPRQVILKSPDPWLSSTHARIVREGRGWKAIDAGSKNGSALFGKRFETVTLEDLAVLELGHTFFLFRESLPLPAPGTPTPVCRAGESVPGGPDLGIPTLSPAFAQKLGELSRVTRSLVSIVLEGETGTGKEVLARAIHRASGRTGDFVAVNCGALPPTLLEAELFGAKKGAFSGATEDRPGLVRSAHGGTLLLDEVGELSAPAQAALLRVLQEREVVPVGSARPITVDVRILAATHRPLDRMVETGTFRRDLWMRLAGYRMPLPPLRDRMEDMGLLAGALLARSATPDPKEAPNTHRSSLSPRAARALFQCAWPGNVRQLEKALSTARALSGDQPIAFEHLPEEVRDVAPSDRALGEEEQREKDLLVAILREHKGNVSAAARAMGKARMQIQRWMKRYALTPEQFK